MFKILEFYDSVNWYINVKNEKSNSIFSKFFFNINEFDLDFA